MKSENIKALRSAVETIEEIKLMLYNYIPTKHESIDWITAIRHDIQSVIESEELPEPDMFKEDPIHAYVEVRLNDIHQSMMINVVKITATVEGKEYYSQEAYPCNSVIFTDKFKMEKCLNKILDRLANQYEGPVAQIKEYKEIQCDS